MSPSRSWTFFRAGGFDQVSLRSGEDLAYLKELDQTLWVALACPTNGLELDARFLKLLDSDTDGRVRAPELLQAIEFTQGALKNLDSLGRADKPLPLASFNEQSASGKALLAAARQVLKNLGKADATTLDVDDFESSERIFAATAFNGDGVISELSTTDASLQSTLREIIDCLGASADRSGQPGVTQAQIDTFFADVESVCNWLTLSETASDVLPLGPEKTTSAVTSFLALRAKVDDYFTRCRLAAFDARIAPQMNRTEADYAELAKLELSASATELLNFPLAHVAAARPLPLWGVVNPAFAGALRQLHDEVISPLLGYRDELSEADWLRMCELLGPHLKWLEAKPSTKVHKLSQERLRELQAANAKSALLSLIEQDLAVQADVQNMDDVERLVRYNRYLFRLATNFVNFRDFYDHSQPAIFQCGTLYLDQRACTLCLRVSDPAKHAAIAGMAGAYLAYVECARPSSAEKFQIVAVITNGDSDNLMVGRNGLFYDQHGRDYDATIVRIVDNPISVRQAFFAPYKKFARLIEEQVAKRASAANDESHAKLNTLATDVTAADKTKPAPEPVAVDKKPIDVGAVAALGVAIGGIGAFFTAMLGYASGVFQLGVFPTLLAIVGLILLISAPSMVLAYVKLRKRNLGPLLDACGWAINTKAKINVPFGATLTTLSKLPPGSKRSTADAFADRALPWKRWVLLLCLAYGTYHWFIGSFDGALPEQLQRKTLLGTLKLGKAAD